MMLIAAGAIGGALPARAIAQGLSPPPLAPQPLPTGSPSPAPAPAPSPTQAPAPAPSPSPPPSPSSSSPSAAYDEGQTLIGQKRYAEAIEKLRGVTVAEPSFAPGWYGLALAARRAGNCSEAIPAYRRYAALRPTEAEPFFGLGLCLRDIGDRPAAATALKRFIALEQRPTQAKWLETARSLVATLESRPPAAASARGATAYEEAQRLRDGGQIEAALRKFAEATTLDPDLMAARAAWGELLVKIHREADAVAVFRSAVDRNPQYPLAWYELGFALRETGRFAEAVDAYRRYIPLRPNDPDPHYGLGRALAKLGRGDEAVRSFETYVAMESRTGEGRWVASAKAEIAALGRGRVSRPATGETPSPPAAPPPAPAPPAAPSFSTTGRDPAPTQPR
jgi:tetratricopeptide (TPR) repeat protein